jgi:hypothetical protein
MTTKTVSTVDLVRQTLKKSTKPLKAKLISRDIRQNAGFTLLRKDVNSILYNELEREVEQNESFEWTIV